MKKVHYWLAGLLLGAQFAALNPAQAQTDTLCNKITIGVNHLTHGELCDGGLPRSASANKESHSSFLFGRTRLTAGFERPGLEVRAVLQNKYVWGSAGNTALNLYEGWAKFTAPCGLFAQVGRVALSYDDERIIGPNDFATASLSHDVLLLGFEGYGHKLHTILAYNQNAENVYASSYYDDGAQAYKTMQTVWYHYDMPWVPVGVSLLCMNMGLQAGSPSDSYNSPKVVYQQMLGGYVNIHPKYVTLEGSYYKQQGKIVNTYMQAGPIDAWMASVKATVEPSDRYGFCVGYDHLSGDDYVPVLYGGRLGLPRHEVNRGFTPLYGSRNTFYGILDYYYESAYSYGFTPGLQNTFVGVFGKPFAQLSCSATWHYLAVATDLRNYDRELGHSIEFQATYDFSDVVSLSAGYTQMMGTETMTALKQGDDDKHARWAWFSLVISPKNFSFKF